jgi:hypothetical protein
MYQTSQNRSIDLGLFGVLLGSPLAVAKAAATLPGVQHDIIQNIT